MRKSIVKLALICCLLSLSAANHLATVTPSNSTPAASLKLQDPGPGSAQSELRTLKQEMDRATANAEQLNQYRELLTRVSPVRPSGGKQRKQKRIRLAATSPCISGDLAAGGPTFSRPQLQEAASGFVQPCVTSMTGSAVIYQAYEFNLSGCATPTITADTGGTGVCSGIGTLGDSVLLVYQKPDGSASTPGSPIFDPAAPCTNIIAANDDSGGPLSHVTVSPTSGNLVIVVTNFKSGDAGTYSLSVDAPGCSITQVLPCMLTCFGGVIIPNDINQCGAVVDYPAPTAGGACGTIVCSPPPASFFPLGRTTVTCTSSTGPSCSFDVIVRDTQAPTITCPANITTTETLPGLGLAVVSFAAPTASDNCSRTFVTCEPRSGSAFFLGTTTVVCNVFDREMNSDFCSFTVTVNRAFSDCLQDDARPGNVVLFDRSTGSYSFCCDGTAVASGVGTVRVRGSVITLQDYSRTRRVLIIVNLAANRGNASAQAPPGTLACTIADKDLSNNTCRCVGGGGTVVTPIPTQKAKKKH
jgi:hypothetical protein